MELKLAGTKLIYGIESNKLAPNTIGSLVSNLPLHHDCIKDLVADARDEMIEKCG
jgi:hypothetical protein